MVSALQACPMQVCDVVKNWYKGNTIGSNKLCFSTHYHSCLNWYHLTNVFLTSVKTSRIFYQSKISPWFKSQLCNASEWSQCGNHTWFFLLQVPSKKTSPGFCDYLSRVFVASPHKTAQNINIVKLPTERVSFSHKEAEWNSVIS